MDAYDGLAPLYDAWAEHMEEDIPFYVSLAREAPPGPIVELAVGTGRVAVEIARQTGRAVIGVDLSPGMLEVARAKAAASGVEALVELRQGDMRGLGSGALAVPEAAALVLCPFRSLLHLRGGAEKAELFRAVAGALAPGGRFAWNAYVFDPHIAASADGYAARHGDVWEYVEHAPADNRIDLTVYRGAPSTDAGAGGPADGPTGPGHTVQLWWATRSEFEGLVTGAGLEVEALYGWFDRSPYDDRSSEMVFVARRPA